eukprot:c8821_g1_i1.p1 GENE.c8821_g1_i1~~c8821_g1_i1.p1  ORF type:complete len:520 (+),score=121.62 c8821_g1_i1:19-1578(+)
MEEPSLDSAWSADDSVEEHILERFELEEKIGEGSYGVVWRARDKATSDIVAIKKLFDAFTDNQDSQRTYREICFLRCLRHHPDIVQLHEIILGRGDSKDVYLICEYVESDLYTMVQSVECSAEERDRTLSNPATTKWIIYQLVRSLAYMHSAGLMHRDIKTGNILIDRQGKIKVCDFGLARCTRRRHRISVVTEADYRDQELTGYIANLRYRAPELLLGCVCYSPAIDMWALGCVIAQIITGSPLFDGDDNIDQLSRIVRLTGAPFQSDIDEIESLTKYEILEKACVFAVPDEIAEVTSPAVSSAATPKFMFKSMLVMKSDNVESSSDDDGEANSAAPRKVGVLDKQFRLSKDKLHRRRSYSDTNFARDVTPHFDVHPNHSMVCDALRVVFADENPDEGLIDLTARLLAFNPSHRITALQTLSHPYLAEVRQVETELLCSVPIRPEIDDYTQLTIEDYRAGVARESEKLLHSVELENADELKRIERFSARRNAESTVGLAVPKNRLSDNKAPRRMQTMS